MSKVEGAAEAMNNYYSYRRGWIDAAMGASMSDVDTSPAYIDGYNNGYKARMKALIIANEKYKAGLLIIR